MKKTPCYRVSCKLTIDCFVHKFPSEFFVLFTGTLMELGISPIVTSGLIMQVAYSFNS